MSKIIKGIYKDINKNIIGIIIPSFNNQGTIKRCLDSVERVKKNKNFIFYCVCIDDFSNDKTREILIEYNKKKVVDKIICNKSNKGVIMDLKKTDKHGNDAPTNLCEHR